MFENTKAVQTIQEMLGDHTDYDKLKAVNEQIDQKTKENRAQKNSVKEKQAAFLVGLATDFLSAMNKKYNRYDYIKNRFRHPWLTYAHRSKPISIAHQLARKRFIIAWEQLNETYINEMQLNPDEFLRLASKCSIKKVGED